MTWGPQSTCAPWSAGTWGTARGRGCASPVTRRPVALEFTGELPAPNAARARRCRGWGSCNTVTLEDFSQLDPVSYGDLRRAMRRLETHYRDLCDIEFTVERGALWLLQTRVGKRTAAAAFRIATQLVDEGLITLDEALQRVSKVLTWRSSASPSLDPAAVRTRLLLSEHSCVPGCSGGKGCFWTRRRQSLGAAQGEQVVLVRRGDSASGGLGGNGRRGRCAHQPRGPDLACRGCRAGHGPALCLQG